MSKVHKSTVAKKTSTRGRRVIQNREHKSQYTLEKILLGSIGSFLLVILFPKGVRFFFRNIFAEFVSTFVTVMLAGLFTQKLFDQVSRKDQS